MYTYLYIVEKLARSKREIKRTKDTNLLIKMLPKIFIQSMWKIRRDERGVITK